MMPEEVAPLLGPLVAAYPATNISQATVAIYSAKLSKFSERQIKGSISQWLDQGKKFPTIAELSEIAGRIDRDPAPTGRLPEWRDTQFGECPPELIGPDGVNRGFPNEAFRRARAEQLARTRERFPGHRPPSDRDALGRRLWDDE